MAQLSAGDVGPASDAIADETPLAAVETGSAVRSPTSDEQADDDLRESLAALSRLATGALELTDVLTRVAEFAAAAIPGADGAGLTLLEQGHADTIVASAPFVAEVDDIQYAIKEGPCITAALQGRTMRSGELDRDSQWPRFGPSVGRLGIHSALSLPLVVGDRVVGAMNVYARAPNAFDEHAAVIGELSRCRPLSRSRTRWCWRRRSG